MPTCTEEKCREFVWKKTCLKSGCVKGDHQVCVRDDCERRKKTCRHASCTKDEYQVCGMEDCGRPGAHGE
jgi:hypothetical protein